LDLRNSNIDRPLEMRLLADDMAVPIDHLGLEEPDAPGYSSRRRRALGMTQAGPSPLDGSVADDEPPALHPEL
jgi:hypothetical protein